MDTAALRAELARALEITADNLVYLAKIWRELERRGEDLSQLRSGLRVFLPLIADGRLDAQAAVQFAGNITMLRALAGMPVDTQRRIAGGEKIAVLAPDGSTRKMRGDEISARMIKQIFAGGRIRSIKEQREFMPAAKPDKDAAAVSFITLRINKAELALAKRAAAIADKSLQDFILSALRKELT